MFALWFSVFVFLRYRLQYQCHATEGKLAKGEWTTERRRRGCCWFFPPSLLCIAIPLLHPQHTAPFSCTARRHHLRAALPGTKWKWRTSAGNARKHFARHAICPHRPGSQTVRSRRFHLPTPSSVLFTAGFVSNHHLLIAQFMKGAGGGLDLMWAGHVLYVCSH